VKSGDPSLCLYELNVSEIPRIAGEGARATHTTYYGLSDRSVRPTRALLSQPRSTHLSCAWARGMAHTLFRMIHLAFGCVLIITTHKCQVAEPNCAGK
jgi:hypothetical protein